MFPIIEIPRNLEAYYQSCARFMVTFDVLEPKQVISKYEWRNKGHELALTS